MFNYGEIVRKLVDVEPMPSGGRMFFLPSAAIEHRTKHLEHHGQKLYVYLLKMNGHIKSYIREGNNIKVVVGVPFTFGDNTSDIDIKLELTP